MTSMPSNPRLPLIPRVPALLAFAALAGVLHAPVAQAAGTVEVSYVEPEKFTDIGWGSFNRERTLDHLTTIFETLGRFLPDGQTLRVEVLDVDLAGEARLGTVNERRVLRGGIDWPQVKLRYTLLADNKVIKSAEEQLRDINYLSTLRGLTATSSNLPYEKRMIENWFKVQFMQAQ
jgi:hypothetical protein